MARRFNQQSVIGSYLDPLADKALICCVVAALGAQVRMCTNRGLLAKRLVKFRCWCARNIAAVHMLEKPAARHSGLGMAETTSFRAQGTLPGYLAATIIGRDVFLVGASFAARARALGWRRVSAAEFFRINSDPGPQVSDVAPLFACLHATHPGASPPTKTSPVHQ